uniref:Uncharacterized protein n=1 Tax=Triticum urartu TaxID=4572 RepID=A0A8R7VA55_TRIUA
MDASSDAKRPCVGNRGEHAGKRALVRPGALSTHLPEQADGLLAEPRLAAPADHRVPGNHILLRHAPEQPEGLLGHPVLQEPRDERGVGDDVRLAGVPERALGLPHGAHLGVVVDEGAAHEDDGAEAGLGGAGVELRADARVAQRGGRTEDRAEGELVRRRDAVREHAGEEGHGVAVPA